MVDVIMTWRDFIIDIYWLIFMCSVSIFILYNLFTSFQVVFKEKTSQKQGKNKSFQAWKTLVLKSRFQVNKDLKSLLKRLKRACKLFQAGACFWTRPGQCFLDKVCKVWTVFYRALLESSWALFGNSCRLVIFRNLL